MLKKLLITTAVSGLMFSTALAQSSMSPNQSSSPGAAQQGSDQMKSGASGSGASGSGSASTTAGSASGAGSANFVSAQKPDQLLASNFEGTDVIGQDNQKIGDVSDILFSKDGKIEAYIVSVGGFLGVGAKDVALAPNAFQLMPADAENNAPRLKVNMNKDQLAQAPNFEQQKGQRTTTGAGSTGTGSSGMAPRSAPNLGGSGAGGSGASGTGGSAGGAGGAGGAGSGSSTR